jgi:hypothetical protein
MSWLDIMADIHFETQKNSGLRLIRLADQIHRPPTVSINRRKSQTDDRNTFEWLCA